MERTEPPTPGEVGPGRPAWEWSSSSLALLPQPAPHPRPAPGCAHLLAALTWPEPREAACSSRSAGLRAKPGTAVSTQLREGRGWCQDRPSRAPRPASPQDTCAVLGRAPQAVAEGNAKVSALLVGKREGAACRPLSSPHVLPEPQETVFLSPPTHHAFSHTFLYSVGLPFAPHFFFLSFIYSLFHPSLYPFIHPSTHFLLIFLPIYPSVHPASHLSLHVSIQTLTHSPLTHSSCLQSVAPPTHSPSFSSPPLVRPAKLPFIQFIP